MRSKILAAFVAGGLLVGAAFLATAISSSATAHAQEDTDRRDTGTPLPRVLDLLDELLDGLVADGTLTQDQADSVSQAAAEKAGEVLEDIREHHDRWRPFARGLRFGALLDDGGIDQGEYDLLDDGHLLKQHSLGEELDDGLITPEELRQLLSEWRETRKGT